MNERFGWTRVRVAVSFIAIGAALVVSGALPVAARAATFDAESILSNDNMRASTSMSEAQVQAFLEAQPSLLASLVTTDYTGVPRKASSIIWRACQAWQISPKVMLVMLQKEQSLLTRSTLATNTLSRAIGAGCPNGYTNKFPGFGQQMWNGARLLSGYGEGTSSFVYYPGVAKTIYWHSLYGDKLHPKNLATFKLYVYNPSVPGNTNFYTYYERHFGNPLGSPRLRPVYKFRKYSNGTYLYTASDWERYRLRSGSSKSSWQYQGVAFTQDTMVPATATVPVYRFKNRLTKKYSFTSSPTTYKARRTTIGRRTWDYQGVAYRIARSSSPDSVRVLRFRNRRTGAYSFTASTTVVARYRSDAAFRRIWDYDGVHGYLPRFVR